MSSVPFWNGQSFLLRIFRATAFPEYSFIFNWPQFIFWTRLGFLHWSYWTLTILVFLTYLDVRFTGPVHFSFTLILISKNVPLISSGRCWESIDDTRWWIIKAPILVTILVSQVASLAAESSHTALLDALMLLLLSRQVNFILFICIIRILRQKMNCPDIGRKESNQYS